MPKEIQIVESEPQFIESAYKSTVIPGVTDKIKNAEEEPAGAPQVAIPTFQIATTKAITISDLKPKQELEPTKQGKRGKKSQPVENSPQLEALQQAVVNLSNQFNVLSFQVTQKKKEEEIAPVAKQESRPVFKAVVELNGIAMEMEYYFHVEYQFLLLMGVPKGSFKLRVVEPAKVSVWLDEPDGTPKQSIPCVILGGAIDQLGDSMDLVVFGRNG